jgi:pimeloyl-ACP methyl ester carboxylesterase
MDEATRTTLATAAVAAAAVGLASRRPAAVGRFVSAAARDAFLAAYDTAMAALPRPDQVLDVRTGFGVVRVHRFDGDAPGRVPLVLLPGRAAASPMWAPNLASLIEQSPVYTLDLLGEAGLSVQGTPITNAGDQAHWLHEVLDRLPEPQLDVLGASIGGWTAVNLAARRPAKVRSLALLDPVLVFARPAVAAVVRSVPVGIRALPTRWRDSFAAWTANGAPVRDVPIARMIEAGMRGYALALPAPRRITSGQLARLDLPVLVVVAGRSRMHDPRLVAATARRTLRRGRVVVFPDASHALSGECPDLIACEVASFRGGLP